jgi:hypothetical protein
VFHVKRSVNSLQRLEPAVRVGLAILAFQCVLVFASLWSPANDFAWAPYTTQTRYEVTVDLPHRRLSPAEAAARYRFSTPPWEVHSYRSLIASIQQYERTYGAADRARVSLRYSVNDGPWSYWEWTAQ